MLQLLKNKCFSKLKIFLLLSLLSISTLSYSENNFLASNQNHRLVNKIANQTRLPAYEAFQLDAFVKNKYIIFNFNIAPGYYLYKDKFVFIDLDNNKDVSEYLEYPKPEIIYDDLLDKEFNVFENEINLKLNYENYKSSKIQVIYQGCAADGFCYAPQTKIIDLKNYINDKSKDFNESNQSYFYNLISNNNIASVIAMFFGIGLMLSVTPCVLPMIPILLSIIMGQKKQVSKSYSFLLALTYVTSMALVYAIAGLIIGYLGKNLQAQLQNPVVIISISLFIILIGLELLEVFTIKLPAKLNLKIYKIEKSQNKGSVLNAVILGSLSALVISPCITPAFAGVLAFLAKDGSPVKGGISLFFMGLGIGFPLILFAVGGSHLLPRTGSWMIKVKKFIGFILIAMAIWLVKRVVSFNIEMLLWGSYAVLLSIYIGLFTKLKKTKTFFLKKGITIVIFIYGIALIIGGLSNGNSFISPLSHLSLKETSSEIHTNDLSWQNAANVDELNSSIQKGIDSNKKTLIFYHAKWCITCDKIKEKIFLDEEVKNYLHNYNLISIDVTESNDFTNELMDRFKVFGPPSIIFIDSDGNEIKNKKIVGFVSAKDLLKILK